jgi:tRNA dimethylallyltransferase
MQVYRSMPIVSQAPPAPPRGTRAHLAEFVEPTEEYSAALYRKAAEAVAREAVARKRTPLVVGGTGLYLRALLSGLFEGDSSTAKDEEFRARLAEEEKVEGPGSLHRRLEEADAPSAARIHPNDLRRVIRALEVLHLTRVPLSVQMKNRRGLRDEFRARIFLLAWDRAELYARIDRRVERMFDEGLIEEVRGLLKIPLSLTASTALGIREVKAYLEGAATLEQTKDLLKMNTRHYAKRQLSWFRHEPGVESVPVRAGDEPRDIAAAIFGRIGEER